MNKFRTRVIIVAVAAVLTAPLAASSPAGAIPISGNGCNAASGIQSSTIGWFPAVPSSMSSLKVACGFNNNTGTNLVSASFTIHDANVAQYHNGAGRTVKNTAATVPVGSTTIPLASVLGTGIPTLTALNRVISGPGIAPRSFVTTMSATGVITLNQATIDSDPNTAGPQPIPASSTFNIENSSVRSVDDAVGVPVAGPSNDSITSASANFTAADTGKSVSGTSVPPNTTATFVNATTISLSNDFEAACTAPCTPGTLNGATITIGGTDLVSTTRSVNGANVDSATVIKTAGNTATWAATDVGLKIQGTCLNGAAPTTTFGISPAAAIYITALGGGSPNTAHNATTTGGLPLGSTECTIVIGEASANAPANGDVVAQQNVMLNLKPSLVAGSDDCGNDQPEGFGVVGEWYNPGSFQGTGLTNLQPGDPGALVVVPPTKAIGQIWINTSAANYSAFVIERRAGTPGDPDPTVHYDIVFPFAPTGIAMCSGTVTSPGLAFSISINAISNTVSQLPTGTGRPGAGQLRSIKPSATGGYITTSRVTSDNPAIVFAPTNQFDRSCFYNTAPNPVTNPNVINFQCGPG
jgi:hypothetical protein